MTISVAWATTKRIFVPRADMPVVQASPEIRELNVNTFRLALKDLEAATAGMPWPDTHRHATETTLSGIVYARFFEILDPYLVEFEDGQYSVRTTGANHNILDVKINNQVSLLVQNSAGLISVSGGDSTDWTSTEREQIRGALGIVGTQATPAGGGHLQDVRTPIVANLDASVSSRAVAGQGLTSTQSTMLLEIYRLYGLDPTKPLVVTGTSRRVPGSGSDINQSLVESPPGTVTVTRQ